MPGDQGYTAEYLRKPYDQSPLLLLLDGIFHPDWRLHDPTVEAAIGRDLLQARPADQATVVTDLESVIDQMRDPKLKDLIARHLETLSDEDRLGMDIGPWLLWLRRRLLDPSTEAEEFRQTKSRVMATSVPSSGDNLLGMQIDCDAYLEIEGVLDDVLVQATGDPASLLRGTVRGRVGVPVARLAAELEWVWLSELRYRYLEAHIVRAVEGTVSLDFVTQIGPAGFYVTGTFDVHASP